MGERNITYFDSNPDLIGMADLYPDITYSTAQGQELKLTLLTPWRDRDHESAPPRHPLIVFVQGSAWTFPNVNYEIPQLAAWARAGYVVATVTHRNRLEGHPFPAFLEDVKTSIRFLRKNADTYGLDPHRVCIWGTSSGGNTALLVGLTGNDPAFKTQEYPEESDGVQLVIDCFGPTDMIHFGTATVPPAAMAAEVSILAETLAGSRDLSVIRQVMESMSPYYRVQEGGDYPPFLLLHGDADPVVPYDQSLRMYDKLVACGVDTQMACIKGAPHEGSFWSQALLDYIAAYIQEKL